MNPSSGTQVATLLFGGTQNTKTKEHSPTRRAAEVRGMRNSGADYAGVRDSREQIREMVDFRKKARAEQMAPGANGVRAPPFKNLGGTSACTNAL